MSGRVWRRCCVVVACGRQVDALVCGRTHAGGLAGRFPLPRSEANGERARVRGSRLCRRLFLPLTPTLSPRHGGAMLRMDAEPCFAWTGERERMCRRPRGAFEPPRGWARRGDGARKHRISSFLFGADAPRRGALSRPPDLFGGFLSPAPARPGSGRLGSPGASGRYPSPSRLVQDRGPLPSKRRSRARPHGAG